MADFKDLLDVGLDLGSIGMEIKNWSRFSSLARGGISSFLGNKKASTGDGEQSANPVEENKMQEGELYAFLGYLSALHSSDGKKITEYLVKDGEERIFPRIVQTMKPGAGLLLMRTIGVDTTSIKERRVVDYIEHEVNGKITRTPITEETVKRVNLTGPQLVSALTWLASQGNGTDEDKVKRVVADIESFRLFESKADAAKALGAKSVTELKRFTGWLDTHAHVAAAVLTLGPKQLQSFLDRPACDHALAAIKAEVNLDRKRKLQEEFQDLLIVESEGVNTKRKGDYSKFSKRNWWMVAGAFVLTVLVTGLAQCN